MKTKMNLTGVAKSSITGNKIIEYTATKKDLHTHSTEEYIDHKIHAPKLRTNIMDTMVVYADSTR